MWPKIPTTYVDRGRYAPRVDDVELHSSPGVSLVLDSRHFPVVIGTWFGTPNREAVTAATTWLRTIAHRAAEEDIGFVLVSDMSMIVSKPDAELRASLAQGLDEADASAPGHFLAMRVVVRSAIMRGIIAMILWLLRRNVRLATVATLTTALTQVKLALHNAGTAPPASLDPQTYECPIFPDDMFDEVSNG